MGTDRADAIHRERVLRVAELKQKSILRVTLGLSHVLVIHLPKLLVRFDLAQPSRGQHHDEIFPVTNEQ